MKKKGIIITSVSAIVVIAVIVGVVLFNNKPNQTPVNQDELCEGCTLTNDKTTHNDLNIKYSGVTKEYNAYDFIIEKMEQAQYWTYEQYEPIYNTVANHYSPSKEHMIKNATGWILYDEDTASFARGFEGRLIINFADDTATSNEYYYVPDYDDSSFSLLNEPSVNAYTYYDFKNGTYCNYVDDVKYEEYYSNAEYDILWDEYNEINRTLIFYDRIFNELGIPLMNMPNGTLASYKNKTINVPVELIELKYWDREQDDLIHSPFDERVGWSWNWEDDEDNIWLDDYRDIFNQQFPQSTEAEMEEVIDLDGSIITENTYAPVFLCLTNKMWSDVYENEEGLTGDEYYNYAGAFETYYLKPLYKQIFGFNGVYFYDESKMPEFKQGEKLVGIGFKSVDEFNNNFKLGTHDLGDLIYIYDKGDTPIGSEEQMVISSFGFDNVVAAMNRICKHYNIQSQFGDDYPTQLSLLYNVNEQLSLGLR